MTKHCVWCDGDFCDTKDDFWHIHKKCAEELMDCGKDLKSIDEILKGIHVRNKDDGDKLNVVYVFVNDMIDFRNRWENTMKRCGLR